jgi:hypothetical protein
LNTEDAPYNTNVLTLCLKVKVIQYLFCIPELLMDVKLDWDTLDFFYHRLMVLFYERAPAKFHIKFIEFIVRDKKIKNSYK